MNGSQEAIASNILANRLKRLVELGMLTKRNDPAHKQKAIYSLTEPSIELVPIMAALGPPLAPGGMARESLTEPLSETGAAVPAVGVRIREPCP